MFRTLRRRSIVSHVLPLLLTLPLVGIALIYGVETQVLVPGLAQELAGEAELIGEPIVVAVSEALAGLERRRPLLIVDALRSRGCHRVTRKGAKPAPGGRGLLSRASGSENEKAEDRAA